MEDELGRDLYTFNLVEIKRLLHLLQPLKVSAATQNGAMIRSYISWSIVEGYRDNAINPLDGIPNPNAWYKEFVDQSKETIFHADRIKYVVKNAVNYQDAVIVQLIFEGVMGESCEELLNLTVHDIDFDNNYLHLRDKNGETRDIWVTDECMRLIRGALDTNQKYVKRNGQFSPNTRNTENELVDNNFLLKKARARTKDEGRGDIHLVLRRLKMLSEVFDIDYFTATNIRNSGMLYWGKLRLDEKRKTDPDADLDRDDYDVICERFGISKINNGGNVERNYYPYRKEFLNVETINKVYGK